MPMTIEGKNSPLSALSYYLPDRIGIRFDIDFPFRSISPCLMRNIFWNARIDVFGTVLAGLAFMFSSSILLQILWNILNLLLFCISQGFEVYSLACAIYGNWWPMLSALMYVVVPMPCMFFGGGSTQSLISRDGGGWIDAAKFLTGASTVGSLAIPIILRHAGMIETGAMLIEFTSFFIFICTVMCFHRASLDDDW
ncbi:hypothetical protein HID58_019731 [Brassica napus]|uniref:Vacuolar protein sorting-associated protein 55 homolog n=1 Tax=Brassica napus TaxID=3708 RepID=A0ABQ8DG75_BRANA|nr:hypothetical protein HID58_019731 [Brassica napus]